MPASTYTPPTATQPLERAPEATGGSRQWGILAGAGVVAIVLGVIAGLMWPAGAGELVANAQVGPGGGNLRFSDGGEMQVPKGAVSSQQTIKVRKTTTREPARVGSMVYPAGSLPVYLFDPLTLSFREPVILILPLPAGAVGARIYVIRDGTLELIAVRPSEDGRVRLVVTGFSGGRLVVRA